MIGACKQQVAFDGKNWTSTQHTGILLSKGAGGKADGTRS